MPGGDIEAYKPIAPAFQAIAAKVNGDRVAHIGPRVGHYVKMVHNGIEYGIMQATARCTTCRVRWGDRRRATRRISAWNQAELNSYLIEITAEIFARRRRDRPHWLS